LEGGERDASGADAEEIGDRERLPAPTLARRLIDDAKSEDDEHNGDAQTPAPEPRRRLAGNARRHHHGNDDQA
jgi:hypothetical protein